MRIGGTYTSALTTFAGLGLAAILAGSGKVSGPVRLGWSEGGAEPRLHVTAGEDDVTIASVVQEHARSCICEGSWMMADLMDEPWSGRGAALSPRVKDPATPSQWKFLQQARYQAIEKIGGARAVDAELVGALGEPAYWAIQGKDKRTAKGSSRWDMKTRNRGEELVAGRMRKLARYVSERSVGGVRQGLTGETVNDEAYKVASESRTATGLQRPQFTDSALAWCGLWGISAFPVVHQLGKTSATAGAVPAGRFSPVRIALPVLTGMRSIGRWRAVLSSWELALVSDGEGLDDERAQTWLHRHGVIAIASYPRHELVNSNGPNEYWLEECSRLDPISIS